jgi:two-component system response regulator RegA
MTTKTQVYADTAELPSLILVDDGRDFLIVLSQAMQKHGFDVKTAISAEAGIALAQTEAPKFAVVDLKWKVTQV